jgi:hypothetical protein
MPYFRSTPAPCRPRLTNGKQGANISGATSQHLHANQCSASLRCNYTVVKEQPRFGAELSRNSTVTKPRPSASRPAERRGIYHTRDCRHHGCRKRPRWECVAGSIFTREQCYLAPRQEAHTRLSGTTFGQLLQAYRQSHRQPGRRQHFRARKHHRQ